MQKKLIALAVLSVVSAPVFAQSQVQVGGIIDVGVETTKQSDNSDITRMLSSGMMTNRLFFKGSEDLGNGLKANFHLETQPGPDTGTAPGNNFWGRTSTVGLSSNSWGSVNLGSQYTPWFSARAANDIFYTAGAGSNYSLETGDTRMSNSIRYDSPNFNGFTFAAMYGMGEASAANKASYNSQEGTVSSGAGQNDKVGRSAGLNIQYKNGPLALRYGYDNQYANQIDKTKRNNFNGSYDFKVVKLVAGWNGVKTDNNGADYRSWYVGGVMPVFGKDAVKLEYTDLHNKLVDKADAKLIALGYEHNMSKRTSLYATYAKLTNEENANWYLLTGDKGVTPAGFDPSSFQVGIKHSF